MANLAIGRTMGRKKKTAGDEPKQSAFVTVKIGRTEHAKLRIVAAHQDRDLADILTDIVRAPIDRLWKQALKEQGEQAEGEGRR